MSSDDRTRSMARGDELRENLADTDARRAEEEAAKAQEATDAAAAEQEKREKEAEQERDRARRVHEASDEARARADDAVAASSDRPQPEARTGAYAAGGDGSTASIPGLDKLPPAAQRPEVLVGAAFAGSFILARVLKRIFD
ncbi:MAG TPA: hypothetical protein VFX80_05520 [Solirubrobacteraceae bacterium]|nr:hypothetical protein [Solirubrobacteraceae bacterium]